MKISALKTNRQSEVEGIWVDGPEGLRLKVARMGNPKYQAAVRRIGKPHARQLRQLTADTAIVEDVSKRAVAETILLGWENLQDNDGKDIPYSSQKAYELFNEVPDFYTMVCEYASDVQLYRDDAMQEAQGNS